MKLNFYDKLLLNLHCDNCGSSKIESTNKYYIIKDTLGLKRKELIYKCTDCNEEFIICKVCNGTGFITKDLIQKDYIDCPECHGMGVIKIKNLNIYI